MPIDVTHTDTVLLMSIAEFRTLTAAQLAYLHGRNVRALRRRLRSLAIDGLIQLTTRAIHHAPGRPEAFVTLTESGIQLLCRMKDLSTPVPLAQPRAEWRVSPTHVMLENTLRLQLTQLARTTPDFSVEYLSSSSAWSRSHDCNRPLVVETLPSEQPFGCEGTFVPDGVFALRHRHAARALLFFVEVDTGTEPLVSRAASRSDVRQKLYNYQRYFASEQYRRYDGPFNCSFRGFRLLFLASGPKRLVALCRLVSETPPSGFIWLTDCHAMLQHGVWGDIWVPGGALSDARKSILGARKPATSPEPIG
ncbi:MAG: replication-relaxation family protein [Phycisphaerae bacterium]|nr:replication-relaxation family protein [Phycisphaerae bacterium]